MFYITAKRLVSIFFNTLNSAMGGHLPPFGCACVVIEQEGKYLVLERPDGKIVLPGGFMQWQERPEQTAKREGYEETGMVLEIGNIINVYSGITKRFDDMSTLTITYQATVVGGTLRPTDEGHPCWLDEQTLRARMGHGYAKVIDDYLVHCQRPERIGIAVH